MSPISQVPFSSKKSKSDSARTKVWVSLWYSPAHVVTRSIYYLCSPSMLMARIYFRLHKNVCSPWPLMFELLELLVADSECQFLDILLGPNQGRRIAWVDESKWLLSRCLWKWIRIYYYSPQEWTILFENHDHNAGLFASIKLYCCCAAFGCYKLDVPWIINSIVNSFWISSIQTFPVSNFCNCIALAECDIPHPIQFDPKHPRRLDSINYFPGIQIFNFYRPRVLTKNNFIVQQLESIYWDNNVCQIFENLTISNYSQMPNTLNFRSFVVTKH